MRIWGVISSEIGRFWFRVWERPEIVTENGGNWVCMVRLSRLGKGGKDG